MMARVDAGEDPRGPQTMGTTGEGGGTVGDLYENSNEDWIYGTATTGSSDESSTEGSEGDTSTVQ